MNHIDVLGAANDLRSAHLLLLANHGELTNVTAGQVRDLIGIGGTSWDGFPSDGIDRSRTQACNARYLEAQVLLRSALSKLGARDRRDLAALALPSDLLDALGGVFDGIVLAQEMANVDQNRRLANEVERAYHGLRATTNGARLPSLPSLRAAPDPETRGEGFANAVGMVVGQHPQFWTTSRWVMIFGSVAIALSFIAYVIVAGGR